MGKYGHEIKALEASKSKLLMQELLEATEKITEPFPWDEETDAPVDVEGGLIGNLIRKIFSVFKFK